MRPLLLELLLSIVCSFPAFAQENDPWIGTWTSESYSDMDWENSPKDSDGTYTEIIRSDYKRVIRITSDGENYSVRMKVVKVKDSDDVSYCPPMEVIRVDGNTMFLESRREKQPFYSNGTIEEYSDITYYYTLSLKQGTIHFRHSKFVSVNYTRNMRYKDTETFECLTFAGNDLYLFNDEW